MRLVCSLQRGNWHSQSASGRVGLSCVGQEKNDRAKASWNFLLFTCWSSAGVVRTLSHLQGHGPLLMPCYTQPTDLNLWLADSDSGQLSSSFSVQRKPMKGPWPLGSSESPGNRVHSHTLTSPRSQETLVPMPSFCWSWEPRNSGHNLHKCATSHPPEASSPSRCCRRVPLPSRGFKYLSRWSELSFGKAGDTSSSFCLIIRPTTNA